MAKPVKIEGALKSLLQSLGLEKRIKQAKVVEIWAEVVGDQIASATRVLGVGNGTVVIAVKDSIWRQQLVFEKPEIVRRLNEALGEELIADIFLK